MANGLLTAQDKQIFKRGTKILIPAGVLITSMNPKAKGAMPNKRARWVTVHRICEGISYSVDFWLRTASDRAKFIHDNPEADIVAALAAYDALRERRDASTNDAEIREIWELMKEIRVWSRKPSVSWLGSGSYWCDCPLEGVRAQPATKAA